MKTVKAVVFALVAGLAMSAAAAPKYQATLTASGYTGESTLTNFPVLVRISETRISGFSYDDCAANGADISFKGADGTTLVHEIDTWNPEGESLVWVKLPTLAKDTTFTMGWKDAAPVAVQSSDTWTDYVGVWHMGEADGVCSNSSPCGAKYDATPAGTGAANSALYVGTDAPVGGARCFSKTSVKSYLSVPSYDAENVGGVFTMSAWVRVEEINGNYPRLFNRKNNYGDSCGWEVEVNRQSYTDIKPRGASGTSVDTSVPSYKATWVHLSFVFNGTTLSVYGNGAFKNSGFIAAATDHKTCGHNTDNTTYAGDLRIGSIWEPWIASYDECRLMKGAASADWVKTEYDTVQSASFLAYGEAEDLFAVTERITDAGWQGLGLKFAAATTNRALTVVWDATDKGTELSSWTHKATIEVAANDTTASLDLTATTWGGETATWGGETCKAVRFCFADASPLWSDATIWSDPSAPRFDALTLDGTGGDSLKVSGTLKSFVGDSCTLQVYVGKTAASLAAWDGATTSLTQAGDFSFTLCESDATAARYLTPGQTYYVQVKATAGALTGESPVAVVEMKNGATVGLTEGSANHRKLTVKGALKDLGMTGETTITLWAGTSNDPTTFVQIGGPVKVSTDAFTISGSLEKFYTTYYWQVRTTNVSASGATTNTPARASSDGNVYPKDTATYTMKDGADGNWNDPACWDDNANGDCLGIPSSSDASVSFAANRKGRLVLTNNLNKAIYVSGENADVTIVSAGGTQRTITSFSVTGTRAHLTLDGVKFTSVDGGLVLGQQAMLSVTNGANISTTLTVRNLQGGTIEVADKSTLKIRYYDFGPGTTTVNDATMEVIGGIISFHADANTSLFGTNAVFRYLGKSPLLKLSHTTPWLYSQIPNKTKTTAVALTFEYEVPVGGYETAPFQASSPSDGFTRKLGGANGDTIDGVVEDGKVRASLTVNVSTNSPALKSAKGVTATPLISWPKAGISLDFVKEGFLPKASRDSFVWGDYLESDPTTPTTLSLTLGSRFGFLLFVR